MDYHPGGARYSAAYFKQEAHMSDATLQAVHDAIAAHITDESDGESVLLTDWQLTAAAALAERHDRTLYFNVGTNSPYHHRLGLMYRGLELLEGGPDDDG